MGSCTSLLIWTALQLGTASLAAHRCWSSTRQFLWASCPSTASRLWAEMLSFLSRHLNPLGGALLTSLNEICRRRSWSFALAWVGWELEPLLRGHPKTFCGLQWFGLLPFECQFSWSSVEDGSHVCWLCEAHSPWIRWLSRDHCFWFSMPTFFQSRYADG